MGFLSRSSRILEWPTEGRNWVGQPHTTAHRRLLMPKYLFKGVPIAWECSECLKLFPPWVNFWPAECEKRHMFNQNFGTTFVRYTCCPECWSETWFGQNWACSSQLRYFNLSPQ